jgi:hypothetical protein
MRRMWAAGAVVLACLALGGTSVEVAAATPLDYNISVDSGAEAARGGTGGKVAIPGWKTSSLMTAVRYGAPGFLTRAQARKVMGESNVFYCGGATEGSTARQKIVISGRNAQIDGGELTLDLSVRIGSTTNDGDSGVMIIRFLNGMGGLIGTLQTDTVVTNSGLLPRIKASGGVPPATRSLQLILSGTSAAGTGCDVLFDNVSVHLAPR